MREDHARSNPPLRHSSPPPMVRLGAALDRSALERPESVVPPPTCLPVGPPRYITTANVRKKVASDFKGVKDKALEIRINCFFV